MTVEAAAGACNQPWIRGPVYDLALITGGAFVTLLIAVGAFQWPLLLPAVFWIWVVAFEGSHFWATFTRTYLDTAFRRKHGLLLGASLVFFLFPAMALLAEKAVPGVAFATLYGLFIFVWSLYHNARQHYGFMSIYAAKAGMEADDRGRLVKTLYASVCLAQAHFLLNMKAPAVLGFAKPRTVNPTLAFLTDTLPMVLSACALLYLACLGLRLIRQKGHAAFMPLFYTSVCWLFYALMFYVVAPRDHFVQSLNGVETLMLIAVMNSLFHNIQYHAIVYHYGRRRYHGGEHRFGPARFISKGFLSYAGFSLLMGTVFGLIVWYVGDWPNAAGAWTQPAMHAWAYVLFFGIIGHHFYLDQKIWRPSKSAELRTYLNTPAA